MWWKPWHLLRNRMRANLCKLSIPDQLNWLRSSVSVLLMTVNESFWRRQFPCEAASPFKAAESYKLRCLLWAKGWNEIFAITTSIRGIKISSNVSHVCRVYEPSVAFKRKLCKFAPLSLKIEETRELSPTPLFHSDSSFLWMNKWSPVIGSQDDDVSHARHQRNRFAVRECPRCLCLRWCCADDGSTWKRRPICRLCTVIHGNFRLHFVELPKLSDSSENQFLSIATRAIKDPSGNCHPPDVAATVAHVRSAP